MHKFILFEADHIVVMALTLIVPLILAFVARRSSPVADAAFRHGFAALLIGTWIAWYALFVDRSWLAWGNALPLNLCDWATIALLLTLIWPDQKTFELAYFWAFAGTIQGLVTPDVNYSFPEPQFVVFFMSHATIIAAALYLTLGTRMRQVPASLPRVIAWTMVYAVTASAVDWMLGTNYGFFRAKPSHATFFDLMSAWPYYIPETVLLGVLAALVLYLPFFFSDRITKARMS
ncbi:MAG TPA: TIGR02206 family membrane protein [Rhizomicrobium sp.]|nr:TIGR02206 family membrane protein [Rhizomicrobium sp.]